MEQQQMSFFAELQRRNVFRVGIAYAVIGWLLAQIAELAFDAFGAPDWVLKSVLFVLLLGLPLALFFAWAFELTPEGLKLEKNVDRSKSITTRTGRKLDFIIIGVLGIAVAFLLVDKFLISASEAPPDEIIATESQSIAVLPFVNMSDDADHFADGLSEELLNLLAKIPNLKVAGRTSSFAFKGRYEDFNAIGDALKVEHVLEGSVRRSGDTLRVTAQLIKVDDGYHVWSESYDRKMADIFEIQDDVAGAITNSLRLQLLPRTSTPTADAEAYALYLEALPYVASNDQSNALETVLRLVDRAIERDPEFARAHELKAMAYWMTSATQNDGRVAASLVKQSASTALQIDGTLVLARMLVEISDLGTWSWAREFDAVEAALEAAPDNFNIHRVRCYGLFAAGYLQESMQCSSRLIELEPLSTLSHWRAGMTKSALGRRGDARSSWQRGIDIGGSIFMWDIALDHLIAKEYEAAIGVLENIPEPIHAWSASDARQILSLAEDAENGKASVGAWIDVAVARAGNLADKMGVYLWYLALGRLDDYWGVIEDIGAADNHVWTNNEDLVQFGLAYPQSGFTRHPAYLKYAETSSMTELWDSRGAPDRCSKDSGNWVCR